MAKETFMSKWGLVIRQFVAIAILLGLLTAVVVSRMEGGGPEYNAQVAELKSHLRHAKQRAEEAAVTGDYQFWGIKRNGSSYQLVVIDAEGNRFHRLLPGQERIYIEADRLNFVDAFRVVYFDDQGRPHVGEPPRPATRDVAITTGYRPVRVISNTGVIP
ncbi:hypothetical protein [Desulfurivibrio alkaliphilus]|uniref:Uncharacterized protein n=1 Tax=Desulfurivibrio alkaliphilus (strain DSM 19089 / UNIQEM U267 / AHT2) TaxID=589865 RepID=D6Z024_DESAT|nr:hypothetical protein [Desulfurivibrio alkaliphilus]ADH87057.1 conserved hypothetical protein [Desulfurivibrio alkaliphilus AHT 2]